MSVPDEEIGNAIDDENGGCGVRQVDGKKKQRVGGYGANFRKAKQVVLVRLAKVKRRFLRKKSRWRFCASSGGGGGGGCLCNFGCFAEPRSGESSFRSTTSDPNDSNFTYEMLRAMIERNDFYSKECNTHVEI